MSPPPPKVRTAQGPGVEGAVAGLLRDLGSQLQRGSAALARETSGRLATGIPGIDALLAGGFPAGRLSEIAGPPSSGRTSVAQALLTHATRRGEIVAWVDAAQAFDPASAEAAGAALERVLWVRPPEPRTAIRCCQCLLDARGFALVVLDLSSHTAARLPTSSPSPSASPSVWQRLGRMAAGTGTALVTLSLERTSGVFADLALSMQPTRAHFSGTPQLLEGLEIEAIVSRQRSGPALRTAAVCLSTGSRAA